MESVKEFLKTEAEEGFVLGCDTGSGSGCCDGSGYGNGTGSGHGYGCSDDESTGSGSGDGCGHGDNFGDGYDFGSGDVKSFCGNAVHKIDGVPTIIRKVSHGVAKGFILNKDFTLTPCFVVKNGNLFAHGKTLHEAREALLSKWFDEMDEEEHIAEFVKCHEKGVKYPNTDFMEWHRRLTGSCLAGREAFLKNHEIDMAGSSTVMEFIALTENDYGGPIIKRLRDFY